MSEPFKNDQKPGGDRPPEPSPSPSTSRRLRDRVSFFEKVWSGEDSPGKQQNPINVVDVEAYERRLADEKQKHFANRLENVQLRSPAGDYHLQETPDGTFKETYTSTTHEGDYATGIKSVKFEKVTVQKTVRHITTSTFKKMTSRTPSDEQNLDDSAYVTHSNGNFGSTASFPSVESLRTTPSKENLTKDDWDSNSNSSSKVTSSSSEWYNEYRTQSFQSSANKLEYVRSKSQFDQHIASIRGRENNILS